MTFKGFIRNKQQTTGILGLLLIVLSLTGLLGCPSPTPPVKSAKPITGTLSYDAIDTTFGTPKTLAATWTEENSGQTVTYSIAPAKNGISIDQATGEVTVAGTAPTTSSGTYTVTATGYGDYKDSRTADITITIAKKDITGTLSYDAIETAVGTAKTQTPHWSPHNTAQTVTYSIAPTEQGISINEGTGKVTVAGDAPTTSSGTYTVTAKGTGDYGGDDIIGTIIVAIQDAGATSITGTLSYGANANIDTTFGTAKTQTPRWSSHNTAQTVTYSIAPAKNGISIDQATGEVTVAGTAPTTSSGAYTVTATGYEDYKDSITADITITIAKKAITGTLSYDTIETAVGTAKTQTPRWSPHNTAQTVTYSIAPAKNGISIDQATGEITVASTAPLSTGTYTVTATGHKDYKDSRTADITITIGKAPIAGTLSYGAIETEVGIAKTQTPSWSDGHNTAQTVTYSIAPAKQGISIDQATGEVSVAGTAPTTSSGTYTVTAKGTGDYGGDDIIGTIIVAIQDAGATSITGTLSYGANANIDTTFGTAKNQTPSWSSHNTAQTVTYSIAPATNGISIDQATGEVTVAGTAPTTSSGAYTVTATGYEDYKDSITADITITIAKKAITGTPSYGAIETEVGTAKNQTPRWSSDHNTAQTVTYSIAPAKNGISIDQATGEITVASTAPVSTGTYTVTADGAGNYEGTRTATLTITITKISITGTLSYDAIDTTFGTPKTQAATWTEEHSSQTVTYSIAPAKQGISINEDTGEVTVAGNAPTTSSGDYTVTATGTGAFTGTRIATIVIAITPPTPIAGAFTYDELSAVGGTVQTSPMPAWTSAEPGQTVEYSITNRPIGADADHVTIDTTTGVVTVTEQARKPSSGAYTITATGTGDFTGTIEASINTTIENPPITGAFSYTNLVMGRGTAKTSPVPAWTGRTDDTQTVEYSITSRPGSAEPTHVTINTATGAVTVTEQALEASSGTYTLMATGIGDFGGAIEATISITIKKPLTGRLSYDDIFEVVGTETYSHPKWKDVVDNGQSDNIVYSITPPPGNAGTGVVMYGYLGVKGTAVLYRTAPVESAGIYTVTATGTGAFSGTIKTTINVTIGTPDTILTGELNYYTFRTALGEEKTLPPYWEDVRSSNQATQGNIEYSIAPPANNAGTGVTINTGDGSITVDSTATKASAGTYTVTAKGVGPFAGTKTATVEIILTTSVASIFGTFSYDDLTTAAGYPSKQHNPSWSASRVGADGDIEYSIAPPSNNAGTGVKVDKYSGRVMVDSTATVASAGEYTVTARGIGAFSGTIEGSIDITILASPKPLTGELSYKEVVADKSTSSQGHAIWMGVVDPDQLKNIEFSMSPPAGNRGIGVEIYEFGGTSSGTIMVQWDFPAESSGTYTVTAKGIGAFQGTIVGYFKVRR